MESPGCALGLGLILGVLIGALLISGSAQFKSAMNKIHAVEREKKKFQEALPKAKETRSQGCADLVVAIVLLLLGVALLIFAAVLVGNEQAF